MNGLVEWPLERLSSFVISIFDSSGLRLCTSEGIFFTVTHPLHMRIMPHLSLWKQSDLIQGVAVSLVYPSREL